MPSKVRVRIGNLELECEGDEAFLKEQIPILLEHLSELRAADTDADTGGDDSQDHNGEQTPRTTAWIASKLRVKSASGLAKAAAAHITLDLSRATFTRRELLTEMATSKHYYKASYVNNFTKTLRTLVTTQVFREVGTDTYALSAAVVEELKAALA